MLCMWHLKPTSHTFIMLNDITLMLQVKWAMIRKTGLDGCMQAATVGK